MKYILSILLAMGILGCSTVPKAHLQKKCLTQPPPYVGYFLCEDP